MSHMTKLHFSDRLSVPLDWITLATVVYGARGSGKTTFGSVAAEEATKARQRFCAIDLKGDWYGLKSTADGKGDGIPIVIFGGDHQDVPLEDGAGAFVGETVANLGQSCILDLEHFSKGKQVRFLAAFFEALYDRNRDPLLLLLDEAQRYAPQRPIDPDAAKCLGAVEDLVKLGRKHGIGPVLFTQRGSGLNKEVSELCDLLVAFRTPGPLDQDRIKDWLDANATRAQRDDVMGQLAGLPTGTAVFASGHPDLKIFGVHQVRRRETFDSSATPKVGQRRKEPKRLAKPDLDELKSKMSAAIERQRADDPKALRARIAELERELKAKPGQAPKAEKIQRVEVSILRATDRKLLDRVGLEAARSGAKWDGLMAQMKILQLRIDKATSPVLGPVVIGAPPLTNGQKAAAHFADKDRTEGVKRVVDGKHIVKVPVSDPRPSFTDRGSAELGNSGLRRMLIALAQRPQGLTNRQLGVRAGLSSQSGSFRTYLSKARTSGWFEDAGSVRKVTAAGLAALGSYEPLPTGRELLEYWLRELGESGASRILRALSEIFPEHLDNETLAQRAGMSADSGSFRTYLSKLRTLELVEGGRGATRASAELFE